MTAQDDWDATFIPGTTVLANKLGITDPDALAAALRTHPAVANVRYPGLPDDPAFAVAQRQMRRFGGLVSFELPTAEAFHRFVEAAELVTNATSFGGLHTSADRRARWGDPVGPGFTRISCGIEDTDDVVADVLRALG